MLNVGDKAPGFDLPNQFGGNTRLADYKGKWVLVWWIPSTMADMTPACCDTIAKGFISASEHNPINVVGLSFDEPELMKKFATRAAVKFPLLADESRTVGEAYDVRRFGEWDVFPKKRSFLVNPEGVIDKIYFDIDPELHVPEVVHDLEDRGAFNKKSFLKRLVGK